MHSVTLWKTAPRPNYTTNVDREYPYSEMPYFSEYDLVKIPISLNDLIDHVDYWGEGRTVSQNGVSGFPNCYNVNQSFRLVSCGPDKDKKIPNRIPVVSYEDCDTSNYIRDNSVVTVTVTGGHINSSSAADIARIVNNDIGKVIVFGSKYDTHAIEILTNELRNKSLYYCPGYELPTELQGLTQFNNYMAFLNGILAKDKLIDLINNENYDRAIHIIKRLDDERSGNSISEIIQKLLKNKSNGNYKIMSFAYQLWINGGKDIIRNHFPEAFKLILDGVDVKIVNYRYGQPLKLDYQVDSYKDRLAWGHSGSEHSKRFCWQFIPVWENNCISFKIYNMEYNMCLKLDVNSDNIGDRRVWGSPACDELRHRYYVEPAIVSGNLVFYFVNCKYHQGLKLAVTADSVNDRALWGHNGDIYSGPNQFKWTITPW